MLWKTAVLNLTVLVPFTQALHADTQSLRATMNQRGGPNGVCTVDVIVDGVAEVEISGDVGRLRTVSGQPAAWRRFECSGPLPRNPVEFRVAPVRGRGAVRRVQDPRTNGGTAKVRIDDPQSGNERYIFDVQWNEYSRGGPPSPPAHWPGSGRSSTAQAIQICQTSVADQLNRDGYRYVTFERTVSDDRPGRRDWITGTVRGNRGSGSMRFSFNCSVDFSLGRVRSVDVSRY